ncbi:reverse transcriptase [Fusarium oxysporum f. sp. phaseoli]
MRRVGQTMMGNLSFFLRGKAASDDLKCAPNLQVIRAVIRFAMDTKRLDTNQPG